MPDAVSRRVARTVAEMRFAASLVACPACGAAAPVQLDFYGDDRQSTLVGRCPGCGSSRSFSYLTDGDPLGREYDRLELGGPEPSQIIGPYQLLAELDRLGPELLDDPSDLAPDAWRTQCNAANRAVVAIQELCKFIPAGADAIAESGLADADRAARATQPERYTRAWLEQQRERLLSRADCFTADAPRIWVLKTGGKLHVSEEIRGLLNQITRRRVPNAVEVEAYLARRGELRGDVRRVRVWDDDRGTHTELEVETTLEEVAEATGRLEPRGAIAVGSAVIAGHAVGVEAATDGQRVTRVRLDLPRPASRPSPTS